MRQTPSKSTDNAISGTFCCRRSLKDLYETRWRCIRDKVHLHKTYLFHLVPIEIGFAKCSFSLPVYLICNDATWTARILAWTVTAPHIIGNPAQVFSIYREKTICVGQWNAVFHMSLKWSTIFGFFSAWFVSLCVCVNAFGCIWVFWLEYSQALCQTFFPFASLLLGSAFFPKVLT